MIKEKEKIKIIHKQSSISSLSSSSSLLLVLTGGYIVGRYGGRGHGLCTLFDGGSIISGLFRRTGITFDGNSPFTLPAGQKLATTNVL
ncbi:hypothetical protein DERP_011574 [Dermatophagoides pteronyssinus]|uniref:Uncharacterized protein n=1 Tax=Dermatophagoides pteronyssinus TaxID=6956 RepID=A0ABQ8JCF7_DERPT|nr:hypothetical protein DERP_011574 [Dermatophagoides pteronyssinus]